MIVAVISDTHGSLSYIQKTISDLKSFSPEWVLHLGDDYEDARYFSEAGFRVDAIPGTWTAEYLMSRIPNRKIVQLSDWSFFLTHTPEKHYNDLAEDPDPAQILASQSCDVFCHGHTHRPHIGIENGVLVLNPGHLKEGDNRGYPPTFAIVNVEPSVLDITILELLNGSVFLSRRVEKSELGGSIR